jgi:hypothetical protein
MNWFLPESKKPLRITNIFQALMQRSAISRQPSERRLAAYCRFLLADC